MTAGFLPLWGFVLAGKFGFNVSDDDVNQYAHWLSNRYKERKNIIWVVGGDTGKDEKWETLGRELKAADPQKLVTFHPGRDGISSYHMWGDADWLDFHMTQTGHSPDLATNYLTINTVYNSSSKPILNGEPAYEDIRVSIPNKEPFKMPPHQIRKAAYWSLLSGGFGHVYGHVEIFQFAAAMPDQPFTYGSELGGPLNVRWFDPQTGESQPAGTVEAAGSLAFSAPFAEDSLLILEPAGDPTLTHTPTSTATETATPDSAGTNTPTATTEAPTSTATAAPTCLPEAGESIINGNYEAGTANWYFNSEGSGNFSTSSPAYACALAARIAINVYGRNTQFFQANVPLKANTAYRLTFAAFSSSGNDLTAELLRHTSPYTNYGLSHTVDLGTGWQLYTVDFTISGFSDAVDDGRLRFRLYSKNNDTYWIDSVSLVKIETLNLTHPGMDWYHQLGQLILPQLVNLLRS